MTNLETRDRLTITLIAHDDDASGRLQSFLGEAGYLRRGAGIREALSADPDGLVLMVWRMPMDHVRREVVAGNDGAAALAQWREATSDALAACRKARSQIVVIDAQMLDHDPQATAQAIAARTGLAMSAPKSLAKRVSDVNCASAQDAQAPEDYLGLPLILAAALLATDPVAIELAFELEAMALRPAGGALPDAGAVAVAMVRTQAAHDAARRAPAVEPIAVTADAAGLAVMLEETETVANNWARRYSELERELETLHAERVLMIESLRQVLDVDSPASQGQPSGSLEAGREKLHQKMQCNHNRPDHLTAMRTMTKEVLRLGALLRTRAARTD